MDFSNKFDHRQADYHIDQDIISDVLHSFGIKEAMQIFLLSGGFSNVNLKVTDSADVSYVLRISDKSQQQFYAECSILKKLNGVVPVPRLFACQSNHPLLHRHVMLLEYVEGQRLDSVEDGLDNSDIAYIGKQIGSILAAIHSVKFRSSGFLGKNFDVSEPFTSFYDSYHEFMMNALAHDNVSKHLSLAEVTLIKRIVREYKPKIDALDDHVLVHSDFNQKNILVAQEAGRWIVTAILDWEFAFSSVSLIDFGNFFRFEDELQGAYKEHIIEGYKSAGGILDDNWRCVAQVLDLLSMIDFLTRVGDHPKTFATARHVIRSTLNALD